MKLVWPDHSVRDPVCLLAPSARMSLEEEHDRLVGREGELTARQKELKEKEATLATLDAPPQWQVDALLEDKKSLTEAKKSLAAAWNGESLRS